MMIKNEIRSFRALLKLQGFTVKEFSEFSGKAESTIWNWIMSDRCPYFYEYVLNKFKLKG